MKVFRLCVFCAMILWQGNVQGQNDPQAKKEEKQTPSFFYKINKTKERISKAQAVNAIRQKLSLSDHYSLQLIRTETDKKGNEHQRYQQYYKGVKVEHGIVLAHYRDGLLTSMNGEYYFIDEINVNPKITEAQALSSAKQHVNAKKYMWESAEQEALLKKAKGEEQATYAPKGELVIFKGQPAWKLDVYALEPESHDEVYISANDGTLLGKNSLICNDLGTATTRYSGVQSINTHYDAGSSQYKLYDYSRGQGIEVYNLNNTNLPNTIITDFVDSDNNWNWTVNDNAGVDALWGAEKTYDYWWNVHERNSFNDQGAKMIAWVNYQSQSANWDGIRVKLAAEALPDLGPKTSLDIIAHEFGHGVKDFTAKFYSGAESGALNEGFSDIWGSCVEYYVNGPSPNVWLFEEDVYLNGGALRSLSNPKQLGYPDTYHGEYWYDVNQDFPPGQWPDNGGIHINCTVLGHWFYILSEGEQGINDIGLSYNVAGTSIAVAEQIVYQAERFYLTSNSGYYDARYLTIVAAEDLMLGSTVVNAVMDSWDAVGVTDLLSNAPGYCDPVVQITVGSTWINSTKLSTLTNQNLIYQHIGGNSFPSRYQNYIPSGYVADVLAGNEYTITVDGHTTSNNYYRVWIDYNTDGDFDDPNELVISEGPLDDLSANILIDPAAAFTLTRLRVAVKTGSLPDSPCLISDVGEVEDYGLRLICTMPTGLSTDKLLTQSAIVKYNAPAGSERLIQITENLANISRYYVTNANQLSVPVNGVDTAYLWRVSHACPNGNRSEWSDYQILDPLNYCAPKSIREGTYRIGNVQVGTISDQGSRVSLNGLGYFDYTKSRSAFGKVYTLETSPGASIPYTLQAQTLGDNVPAYWYVWIDYNANGTFEVNEKIFETSVPTVNTQLTGNLVIPAGIKPSTTRIRFIFSTEPATACSQIISGQIRDYKVIISKPCSTKAMNSTADFIDFVSIGGLSYPSSGNGYTDNTALSIGNILKVSGSQIQLSAGPNSAPRSRTWRVWIDFNQDGDFTDLGEVAATVTNSLSGTFSVSLTMAANALSGKTRMRISTRYGGTPVVCGDFVNGETEDYFINLVTLTLPLAGGQESLKTSESVPEQDASAYPNPVKDILNIYGASEGDKIHIKDVTGNDVYKGEYHHQPLDVKLLPGNQMYILMIQSAGGWRTVKFMKE